MTWSQLPLHPSARILRQFSGAWLVVFGVFATLQLRAGHGTNAALLATIAALGLIGLVHPAWMRWIFVAASVAAFPIGWVMTHLILGILFYVVLTPFALVFRLKGRDILKRGRPPANASMWETKEPTADPARYLRQY
jgi:hypothetical protein